VSLCVFVLLLHCCCCCCCCCCCFGVVAVTGWRSNRLLRMVVGLLLTYNVVTLCYLNTVWHLRKTCNAIVTLLQCYTMLTPCWRCSSLFNTIVLLSPVVVKRIHVLLWYV
jgi:hypothetical protein